MRQRRQKIRRCGIITEMVQESLCMSFEEERNVHVFITEQQNGKTFMWIRKPEIE